MNIFEELQKAGVTYFIIKGGSIPTIQKSYTLVTHKNFRDKAKKINDNFTYLEGDFIHLNLTMKQSRLFKEDLKEYNLVVDKEFGSVYELKSDGFKEFYLRLKEERRQRLRDKGRKIIEKLK